MAEHPKPMDERLHAYLDGELSLSETKAFEGDLRTGSTLRHQVVYLQHAENWSQATRPRAPSSLLPAILERLEEERAASAPPVLVRLLSWSPRRGVRPRGIARLPFRPLWITAVAALAVALALVVVPRERATVPSGGNPPPEGSTAALGPSDAASPDAVRYEFTFRAEKAGEICLAGDFNDWRVCAAPLVRVGEDLWSVSLELPPGRYEYMFVVDGRWVTDPKASTFVDDGFGTKNALLVI